jgi:hypothetical protein
MWWMGGWRNAQVQSAALMHRCNRQHYGANPLGLAPSTLRQAPYARSEDLLHYLGDGLQDRSQPG